MVCTSTELTAWSTFAQLTQFENGGEEEAAGKAETKCDAGAD